MKLARQSVSAWIFSNAGTCCKILVLFVVKSVLRGELWEVPWEVVTLTGVSQAGYLGDKNLDPAKMHPWTKDCAFWLKEQGFTK
jgi:hypothetical protein